MISHYTILLTLYTYAVFGSSVKKMAYIVIAMQIISSFIYSDMSAVTLSCYRLDFSPAFNRRLFSFEPRLLMSLHVVFSFIIKPDNRPKTPSLHAEHCRLTCASYSFLKYNERLQLSGPSTMEPAPSLDYSCVIVGATVDVMQHFMNTSELS